MLRGIRLDFSIPYESWRWRIQITFVPRFTGDCLNRICTFHRLTPFNVSLGLKLSLWLPFDPISVIALLSNLIGIAVVGCHVSQEVRGKLFGRNFLKGFPVLPLANDVDAQPWHNLPTTFVLAGAFLGFRCWTLSLWPLRVPLRQRKPLQRERESNLRQRSLGHEAQPQSVQHQHQREQSMLNL